MLCWLQRQYVCDVVYAHPLMSSGPTDPGAH
jgi:hypothetical protein